MSEQIPLGKLIEGEAARDAIHIAIAPVIADGRLYPGEHIGFSTDGDTESVRTEPRVEIGIVDPFLKHYVSTGERFWMFLFPNTVTGMRHHWQHPAFEKPETMKLKLSEQEQSVAWLKKAAVILGVDYEELIAEDGYLATGDYISNGENIRDEWCGLCDDFWKHRKIVTGRDIPADARGGFNCSC